MKKIAFTMMELLLAIAVIGITAAIVAPALTNAMPDKTKMQVIKAHKVLADVTHDLLNDPSLYRDAHCESWPGIQEVNDGDICVGLGNGDKPLIEPYNTGNYFAEKKYPMLLSSRLELSDEVLVKGKKISFTTIDGIYWMVELGAGGINNNKHCQEYKVTIDLNGDKDPNTIATSKDVKNPDRFMFNVDTYGKITAHPDDKLTAQYLKTRTKFNNKKEDYKVAFGS